ncbi:MAG: hypothetical protein ACRDHS_05895 [Actinomycetota bacterium]
MALDGGADGVGLGLALLLGRGMAAWMRGWRACAAPVAPPRPAPTGRPPAEVVSVLAAMALACTGSG